MVRPADSQPGDSPCIEVCRLGDDGVCVGCLRTADEIAAWPAMTPADRRRLWESLERRRTGLEEAQLGIIDGNT